MPRSLTPTRLTLLDPVDPETGHYRVIIETPKGSRSKLAYDDACGTFVLKKVLPEGMAFPFDFGFIPGTRGPDGDPTDVLVLMDDPVPPGTLVLVRLLGVIEGTQTEKDGSSERNDRVIGVGTECLLFREIKKLSELPDVVVKQIEHFFVRYNVESGKKFEVIACRGRKRAASCVKRGIARHRARSQRAKRSAWNRAREMGG